MVFDRRELPGVFSSFALLRWKTKKNYSQASNFG